ncbi:MAG: multiheme c-type cytochrome [Deltaproteobacteria bacterium]
MRRILLIACAAIPALLLSPGPAPLLAQAWQSAAVCAECHAEIHRTWRGSQHASAFTDPAFRLPFERLRRENPGKTFSCEHCHNPMRSLLSPGDPRAAIFSQEGVTCDFCHSVSAVDAEGPFPRYKARPGVKFGPHPEVPGKGPHVTRFSRLHITSEFCAGCHEFRNAYGVPILSTASEWERSFYRGTGVHCQFCHLPELFDARFIDGKKKKGTIDHAMVGGHSRERLARAIPVRARLVLSGAGAQVTVSVKNDLVGHATPTGIPTHRLRLAATLFDAAGNALDRREEVFERVVGDGTGKALTRPEEIFVSAREVLKDNRLLPKETREVRFAFPAGKEPPATASVALTYEIPTPDTVPALRYIEIPVANRVVTPEAGFARGKAVAIAAAGVLALLAWLRFRKKGGETE